MLSDIIYVLNHSHFVPERTKGDNFFLILNEGVKFFKIKKKCCNIGKSFLSVFCKCFILFQFILENILITKLNYERILIVIFFYKLV